MSFLYPLVRLDFRPLDDVMRRCPSLSFANAVMITADVAGALLMVTGGLAFLRDLFSLKIISAVVHVRLVLSRFP